MCFLWIRSVMLLTAAWIVVSSDPFPPRVNPPCGPLFGKYLQARNGRRFAAFLGIPFAKPPLDCLRFRPPEPADPWIMERSAISQPPKCSQPNSNVTSEDCLYLNVFTPKLHRLSNLPTLVFINGGSFEFRSAREYGPEYLMDEDIVLVNVQYRLGLFGFFSTGDEVVPGNMGLKDVRLGLRWVRDNINSFGGDRSRVTIYGQSVGAAIVHHFMTFIPDDGLFRAGISSSGSALCPWAIRPPREIKKIVQQLATLSNCPNDSIGITECLRRKTADELVTLYSIDYKSTMYAPVEEPFGNFLPLIGPVVEADCVEDRIISGNPWERNTSLPWLVGVNSKEFLPFLALEINDRTNVAFSTFNAMFNDIFPKLMNYQNSDADGLSATLAARKYYLNNRPISRQTLDRSTDLLSHAYIVYPTYEAVLRANRRQTYMYYFDYVGANTLRPIDPDARIGAGHTEEVFFLFSYVGDKPRLPDTETGVQLSRILVRLFANFVTFLDPTPPYDKVQWPPFAVNQSYIHFKQQYLQIENGFLPEDMAFWQSQPFPNRDDNYDEVTCQLKGCHHITNEEDQLHFKL